MISVKIEMKDGRVIDIGPKQPLHVLRELDGFKENKSDVVRVHTTFEGQVSASITEEGDLLTLLTKSNMIHLRGYSAWLLFNNCLDRHVRGNINLPDTKADTKINVYADPKTTSCTIDNEFPNANVYGFHGFKDADIKLNASHCRAIQIFDTCSGTISFDLSGTPDNSMGIYGVDAKLESLRIDDGTESFTKGKYQTLGVAVESKKLFIKPTIETNPKDYRVYNKGIDMLTINLNFAGYHAHQLSIEKPDNGPESIGSLNVIGSNQLSKRRLALGGTSKIGQILSTGQMTQLTTQYDFKVEGRYVDKLTFEGYCSLVHLPDCVGEVHRHGKGVFGFMESSDLNETPYNFGVPFDEEEVDPLIGCEDRPEFKRLQAMLEGQGLVIHYAMVDPVRFTKLFNLNLLQSDFINLAFAKTAKKRGVGELSYSELEPFSGEKCSILYKSFERFSKIFRG